MTGIFSSTTAAARLDSEDTLAMGGSSVFGAAAAVVVVGVMEGTVLPLGLMFSLLAGWEAWGATCCGRGARIELASLFYSGASKSAE